MELTSRKLSKPQLNSVSPSESVSNRHTVCVCDTALFLQPIPRQFVPGPKDIKVLCADDESTALSWTAGIRLAKYGLQLRDNFHKAKLTQFKLEDLGAPEGSKPKADVRKAHY